ncbi:alpha-amylase [Corynebacterium sp. HMSC055G02]|uniref:alpha-amylase family protein n=1 Tax=Corynebacterium TaxID=1716 RepID=UPI0008A183BA|nr:MULTISPECIES: alpha-amylase family protein [Corynebacterium]AYX81402.1 alpha-amylase [Corynebacterium jeikeium]MBS5167276.1 alpha-amylase family protein [Corynebacterium sp.]MCG7268801.1 alpha-amylase family protein [Corynebacterium amycolatum]OFN54762.1 alpha-amylase [Corynebacterium sp. HMSC055G02]OFO24688.1 alpha-amylase [Corynebacterium sp. HMSC064E07]
MSTTPNAPNKTLAAAPEWSKWAIGWHVYPLGFVGAPIREKDRGAAPGNRIHKLIDWLPYVQELGLNVLQLAPVFESTSHGYDTEDYYRIDSRLGTEEDMKAVIEAAHERGIKVLFDGVFNHIGAEAPALKTAKENPDSEEAQLFAFTHSDGDMTAPVFEGHESLVEFDHTSDATVDFVVNVMNYWLARGIDGWRLDAAYAVDPQFWHKVLPRVRAEHPHAFIYGEVIHGDYAEIVSVSGMDSVTEYELWKATWSALKEENFFELDWTLKRHNTFAESFVPVTFVGNHDVSRIATQVGADKAVLAATVLFTVAGVPLVYYGDEQGYTGLKEERIGGDDQIRPVFPDSPEELSTLGADLYRAYQQLVAVRRRFPWLHSARVETDELRNGFLRYRVTATDAALVDDAAEALGETGASGEMPSLVVELNLENGATSAVIRDGDHVEFEFS